MNEFIDGAVLAGCLLGLGAFYFVLWLRERQFADRLMRQLRCARASRVEAERQRDEARAAVRALEAQLSQAQGSELARSGR